MEEVVALVGTIVISSSSVGISVGKYCSSCSCKAATKLRGEATAVAKEQATAGRHGYNGSVCWNRS